MNPTLTTLPTAERTAVFRAFVSILVADPCLKATVKRWFAWEGKKDDAAPLAGLGIAPAIRITPTGGGDEWLSPAAHTGPLYLNFEIITPGYNVDNITNLWRAIGAAFYDPQVVGLQDNRQRLQDSGAYPPDPMFTLPAFTATPDSEFCVAVAQARIFVRTDLGSRGISG